MKLRTYAVLAAPAAAVLAMFFALPLAGVFADAFSEGSAAFRRVFALPTFFPSLAGSFRHPPWTLWRSAAPRS